MARKARGPKKPKCPRSAYIYFVKEYQQHLKRTKGPLPFGESSRLCAARWKCLPPGVKKRYKRMSEKDASRYRKELQSFSPREQRLLRRRKKDPAAPLRPMTAYLWFCKNNWRQVADEHPDLSYKQVMKRLARMWANCDQRTREKFEKMAACDRKCYLMEKKKYKAQGKKRA